MSDSVIIVIPTDPRWVPAPGQEARAVALIKELLTDYDTFAVEQPDEVALYHGYENFESIHCPFCATALDIQPWWTDQLDAAYDKDTGFSSLDTTTPCCGKPVSLNDLTYDWPLGFASWAVSVMNTPSDLSEAEVADIEDALGHAIRVVHAHI